MSKKRPYRVGRSRTGFGLFATALIKKRAFIVEYRGPRIDNDEAQRRENRGNKYLYEINSKVTVDGTPRYNIARYANHSCRPNAESDTIKGKIIIRAIRDIQPGEEIVYDYGTDYFKNVITPSRCRCLRCLRRRAKRQRERRAAQKRRAARAAGKRRTARTAQRQKAARRS
ncbi:MAG TPA: SET domain-containing protein [Pseudolabrys sp.]|nr:SET domain-containing protein [Pseudolabrys sp.]